MNKVILILFSIIISYYAFADTNSNCAEVSVLDENDIVIGWYAGNNVRTGKPKSKVNISSQFNEEDYIWTITMGKFRPIAIIRNGRIVEESIPGHPSLKNH